MPPWQNDNHSFIDEMEIQSSHQKQRAFWLKQLHHWHWITSAICIVAMVLFAATGITLNHASQIEAKPVVTNKKATLPPDMLAGLQQVEVTAELPNFLKNWAAEELSVELGDQAPEWSEDEIYVALPRPGGDAWLRINLSNGEIEYELTDRGWISWLNDLHKGRNTGLAWSWFIDIFAGACLIFSLTGFFLLQMHANNRSATWPLVGLGIVVPLLLIINFIH